jgi:seryl-tRNA synthetase
MFDSHVAVTEGLGLDPGQPVATEVPGVYLFPAAFEAVLGQLRTGIDTLARPEPFRRLTIPPVISRRMIEKAGYVRTFPQLLGTVHSYTGTPRAWAELAPLAEPGGAWHSQQAISDLVLLPAACYPVYATLTGTDLAEPARFAVAANCFRQEASSEIGRLRSFRMAELVTVGTESHCVDWRGTWLDRVRDWFTALGLTVSVDAADDPFFGPGRKLYQAAQRMQELKWELRVPVADDVVQAIASANFHKDHFGETFGFTARGAVGNTACVAFGMERIVLALRHAHGPDPERWPAEIWTTLGEPDHV